MKTLEILTTIQPLLWLLVGIFLPWLNQRLDKLLHSEQYKLAKSVYQSIDPQFLNELGGKVRFLELIQESIKAVSDRELTYSEIKTLTKLIIRDFKLDKALGK